MAEQPLKIVTGTVTEFATTDVALVGGVLAETVTGVNAPGNDLTVVGGAATPAGTGAGGATRVTGGAAGTTAAALAGGNVVITGGGTGGTGAGAVPGGVVLETTRTATNTAAIADGPVLTLTQPALTVGVFAGTADPSAGSGVVANAGSTYHRKNGTAGEVWIKTAAANTAWTKVSVVHAGSAEIDWGTPTAMLVTDSFSAGPTQTLSVAGAFATRDVGHYIRIAGATSAGNNGLFTILSVVPGVSCTYANASAVAQAALATTTYFIPIGTNIASIAITGEAEILTTSHVQAFFMVDSTASHNGYEHMMAPMAIALPCSIPTPGVGFTIYGVTELRLNGKFLVHWTWT
jgi:hypothetical protein